MQLIAQNGRERIYLCTPPHSSPGTTPSLYPDPLVRVLVTTVRNLFQQQQEQCVVYIILHVHAFLFHLL